MADDKPKNNSNRSFTKRVETKPDGRKLIYYDFAVNESPAGIGAGSNADSDSGKTVLVTGGAGYIGSVTVKCLIENGTDVVVIDNLSKGHQEAVHPQAQFYLGDLSDKTFLDHVFSSHKIQAVIHFAGSIEVGESVLKPDFYHANNVINGSNLLQAMKKAGVKDIVFSSTAAVYGNVMVAPITEDFPLVPSNPYGETKLAFEKTLATYAKDFGFNYLCLRYFNACGADGELGEAHDPESHLIPNILLAASGKRNSIKLFGEDYDTDDGTCVRDYIHVKDLATAHVKALQFLRQSYSQTNSQNNSRQSKDAPINPKATVRAINLGTGYGYSVKQVIEAAIKVTKKNIPVERAPRRQGDPAKLVAASGLAREVLNWEPKHSSLEEIIQDAWNWLQAHPDGYKSTKELSMSKGQSHV